MKLHLLKVVAFYVERTEPITVATAADVRGIEIALKKSLSISGTVVDTNSKQPIDGAALSVIKCEEDNRYFETLVTTDATGRYRAYVRPGHYLIWIRADGYDKFKSHELQCEQGETRDLVFELVRTDE